MAHIVRSPDHHRLVHELDALDLIPPQVLREAQRVPARRVARGRGEARSRGEVVRREVEGIAGQQKQREGSQNLHGSWRGSGLGGRGGTGHPLRTGSRQRCCNTRSREGARSQR
eukprot:scaffold83_cov246-Pinguiococcus_pyrenoidosus.AAC.7